MRCPATPELLAREAKSPLERARIMEAEPFRSARRETAEKLDGLREAVHGEGPTQALPAAVEQTGLRVLADFTVHGPPVGWQRVQPSRDGKPYTPARTREFEKRVATYAVLAADIAEPYRGPVALTLTFYLQRPKGCPPGLVHPIHQTCPDTDNLVKSVKDGCNKVVWRDDRQVVLVSARKCFADLAGGEPRTHVSVEAL